MHEIKLADTTSDKTKAADDSSFFNGQKDAKNLGFRISEPNLFRNKIYRTQGNLLGETSDAKPKVKFKEEKAPDVDKKRPSDEVSYGQRVTYVSTGDIRAEKRTISNARGTAYSDIATLLKSSLSQKASERFIVVMIGEDGTILSYALGSRTSARTNFSRTVISQVYWGNLMAQNRSIRKC